MVEKKRKTREEKIKDAKAELRHAEKMVAQHEDGDRPAARRASFGTNVHRRNLKKYRKEQEAVVEAMSDGSMTMQQIKSPEFQKKLNDNTENIRHANKMILDSHKELNKQAAAAKARLNKAKKALKKAEEPLEFLRTDPQAFLLYNMGAFTSVRTPSQIAHSNYSIFLNKNILYIYN